MTPPGLIFPPPDTLSGNHPGAGNPSSDEFQLRAFLHRTTLDQRLHFIVMLCICLLYVLCIYCFFPLFYCPVVSTIAAGAPVIDYVDDDRTPTVELPGKQPFPSHTYRLSIYIYLLH